MEKRIADNVIPVSVTLDVSFFRAWLDFTVPLHALTAKERLVMAHYLKEHYDLSKIITDDAILAQVLASSATKQKIMQACGFNSSNLQVVLHKFKKTNLMVGGKISAQLIPDVSKAVVDSKEFRLMIVFNIEDDKH